MGIHRSDGNNKTSRFYDHRNGSNARYKHGKSASAIVGELRKDDRQAGHSHGIRLLRSSSTDLIASIRLKPRLARCNPFRYASSKGFPMLVVSRKKDEKLIIGNEIEIQVLRIGRDNVRLGIKAPAHISIYRYEIYEAIKNENVTAVTSQIPDKETLDKISKGRSEERR